MTQPETSSPAQQFPYSVDNPPPTDELRNRMMLVHATDVMPKDEYLRPGAYDISINKEWGGDEPPSFRPTLHFSMGGVVQEHGGGRHVWDDKKYAVVTPLGSVEKQVVNLLPHDTFLLGKMALNSDRTALIVPEAADTSHLPPGVQVHRYPPDRKIREAVDDYITAQEGWKVAMNRGDVDLGSPASIEGQPINDPKFFAALLAERPHISFGTHTRSMHGNAYLYGLVEAAVNTAESFRQSYNSVEMDFQYAIGHEALDELEATVRASDLDPAALEAFEEKKAKAQGWFNLMECDKFMREHHGRTLAYAPQEVVAGLRASRTDIATLRQYAEDNRERLQPAVYDSEPRYSRLGAELAAMPLDKVVAFAGRHLEVFNYLDGTQLEAYYSLHRLLNAAATNKQESIRGEHLEETLEAAIQHISGDREDSVKRFRRRLMDTVTEKLDERSGALQGTLKLLDLPVLRTFLELEHPEEPVKGLEDWLARYPSTAEAFRPQAGPTEDEQETMSMEGALGLREWSDSEEPEKPPRNLLQAESVAYGRRYIREDRARSNFDYRQPIAERRNAIPERGSLNRIQLLERDLEDDGQDASEPWAKLGLGEAFRKKFPTDEQFWNSQESFFSIYQELTGNAAREESKA